MVTYDSQSLKNSLSTASRTKPATSSENVRETLDQTARVYLEPAEVSKIENAATNLRDRLLIRLLSHVGCRITEALGIAVEDIDIAKGTVTIRHLKTRLNRDFPYQLAVSRP